MDAVTIATNMAGRGTDILFGGNPDSLAREMLRKRGHRSGDRVRRGSPAAPSRRLGRSQKRSMGVWSSWGSSTSWPRSGTSCAGWRTSSGAIHRQGDPASTRFYLSLEDDLLRIFGSEWIEKIMDRRGTEEGEPIEYRLVTRAIQTAEKRVEAHHFEIWKHLLEYDDVMKKQREVDLNMRPRDPSGREPGGDGPRMDGRPARRGSSTPTRPTVSHRRTGTWAGRRADAPAVRRELPAGVAAREVASREAPREVLGEAVSPGRPPASGSCRRTSCGRSSAGSCST